MFNLHGKPRHVNPQLDRLRKMSPCSEGFNTHLCSASKDIGGIHVSFFN